MSRRGTCRKYSVGVCGGRDGVTDQPTDSHRFKTAKFKVRCLCCNNPDRYRPLSKVSVRSRSVDKPTNLAEIVHIFVRFNLEAFFSLRMIPISAGMFGLCVSVCMYVM